MRFLKSFLEEAERRNTTLEVLTKPTKPSSVSFVSTGTLGITASDVLAVFPAALVLSPQEVADLNGGAEPEPARATQCPVCNESWHEWVDVGRRVKRGEAPRSPLRMGVCWCTKRGKKADDSLRAA